MAFQMFQRYVTLALVLLHVTFASRRPCAVVESVGHPADLTLFCTATPSRGRRHTGMGETDFSRLETMLWMAKSQVQRLKDVYACRLDNTHFVLLLSRVNWNLVRHFNASQVDLLRDTQGIPETIRQLYEAMMRYSVYIHHIHRKEVGLPPREDDCGSVLTPITTLEDTNIRELLGELSRLSCSLGVGIPREEIQAISGLECIRYRNKSHTYQEAYVILNTFLTKFLDFTIAFSQERD